ncbi:hypothetical protein [Dipodfec virus UA04Rod_2041]|uniref:Uncharacterized protein n=1 Tax=Dipodfec virus UA04Rod_2041 TaxID=2929249 RepID=A0A976N224_9VIRU|nr:hypothetical protein [Dipodfec virus UA04Rod_2041]
MHARRVSRCVRRINKSKRQRDPPVAVIGNIACPVSTQSINKRDFVNNILPLALKNRWITTPVPTVSLVQRTISASGESSINIEPSFAAIVLRFQIYDLSSANPTFLHVTYGSGIVDTVNFGTSQVSGTEFYCTVSPGEIIIHRSVGTVFKNFELHSEPITKVEFENGLFNTDITAICIFVK